MMPHGTVPASHAASPVHFDPDGERVVGPVAALSRPDDAIEAEAIVVPAGAHTAAELAATGPAIPAAPMSDEDLARRLRQAAYEGQNVLDTIGREAAEVGDRAWARLPFDRADRRERAAFARRLASSLAAVAGDLLMTADEAEKAGGAIA